MVIGRRQGHRGIEQQTSKLYEVRWLRDASIITFVDKLDREGRDPFDLSDEIEQSLAVDVTMASWPIGMGCDFLGTYHLFAGGSYCSNPASHMTVSMAPDHHHDRAQPKGRHDEHQY
jgi:peptide subunit release factor RF-3